MTTCPAAVTVVRLADFTSVRVAVSGVLVNVQRRCGGSRPRSARPRWTRCPTPGRRHRGVPVRGVDAGEGRAVGGEVGPARRGLGQGVGAVRLDHRRDRAGHRRRRGLRSRARAGGRPGVAGGPRRQAVPADRDGELVGAAGASDHVLAQPERRVVVAVRGVDRVGRAGAGEGGGAHDAARVRVHLVEHAGGGRVRRQVEEAVAVERAAVVGGGGGEVRDLRHGERDVARGGRYGLVEQDADPRAARRRAGDQDVQPAQAVEEDVAVPPTSSRRPAPCRPCRSR